MIFYVVASLVVFVLQPSCGTFYTNRNFRLTEIPNNIPEDSWWVSIEGTQISSIKPDTFLNLGECNMLYLERNNISTISPGAFRGLNKVTSLNLAANELEEISNELWEGLDTLESLYLIMNSIRLIHPEGFKSLGNLNTLALSNNKLSHIQSDMWTGLSSLSSLDLSMNEISKINDGVFSPLKSLDMLYLSYNTPLGLSSGSFDGLESLKWLNLHGTNLTTIPQGVFSNKQLKIIGMDYNQMKTLNENIFMDVSEGEINHPEEVQISLDKNQMQCDWRMCWMKAAQEAGWLLFSYPPSCENFPGVEWEDVTLDCQNVEEMQKAYNYQQAVQRIMEKFSYISENA